MITSKRLASAIVLTAVCAAGCGPVPQTVAVVRTWADLMGQPAINLEGGITVRLGLEADACPRNGGVLLYCLTDGYAPPATFEGPDNFVGPVQVFMTDPGGAEALPGQVSRQTEQNRLWQSNVLYAMPVLPGRAGAVHLDIRDCRGRKVAAAAVARCDMAAAPWLPLTLKSIGTTPAAREGEAPAATADMILTANAPAVPAWDPLEPLPFDKPVFVARRPPARGIERRPAHSPADPLPTLLPAAPDGTLRLRAEGTTLVLESDSTIAVTLPDATILARLQINGRAFVPERGRTFSLNISRKVESGKSLRIHLEPDLAALGAKQGDRIAIQLLYCPNGWSWANDGPAMHTPASGEGGLPRTTNQVELAAP
jgi:hypothetical protein